MVKKFMNILSNKNNKLQKKLLSILLNVLGNYLLQKPTKVSKLKLEHHEYT